MKSIKAQMDELEAALPSVVGPALSAVLRSRGHPPNILSTYKHNPQDVQTALYYGKVTLDEVHGAIAADEKQNTLGRKKESAMSGTKTANPSRSDVLGDVRVKDASEKFSDHRYPAKHAKTGRPVYDERGREVSLPSELTKAKAGVLLKRLANRAGIPIISEEWEDDLWQEMLATEKWAGKVNGEWHTDMEGIVAKTILDDTTSGGLEVVPVEFDRDIISYPLLNGELYPFVDVKEVSRGRRMEGATIDNPTLSWGVSEGTDITEFNTDSLIGEMNTTIFPVVCAITAGRDFLSDAAVDVGGQLTQAIGQRLLEELDDCICNGNGTNRPEGIFIASGMSDVGAPAGGAGTDWQVADLEELIFAVAKQYRAANLNPCFVGNDTTYSRLRGIPWAVSAGWTFAERPLGMDEQSYQVLQYPVRIQNDVTSPRLAFGCLKKYRMYRCVGLQVEWTSEGRDLRLANEALLTVRARFGGKIVDVNAWAKQTQGKA